MAGATKWREERSEERAEERQQEMPHGHGGTSGSPASPPGGHHSTPAPAGGPPEGWSQEEWAHVPQSMRGDVASGKGFMSKEAIQRYINEKK